MTYARKTEVAVERTKAELERTLSRFGATGFVSGWSGRRNVLGFELGGRQVRLELVLPDEQDPVFSETPTGRPRGAAAAEREYRSECRRVWRSLFLVVKAKLVAVEDGISTLEREFLADLVLPGRGGRTVGQEVLPFLEDGDLPPLLTDGR